MNNDSQNLFTYHGNIRQYEFADEQVYNIEAMVKEVSSIGSKTRELQVRVSPALVDRRLEALFAGSSTWTEISVEVSDKFTKDDVHQWQSLGIVSHSYRESHKSAERTTPELMAHINPRTMRKTRPFRAP